MSDASPEPTGAGSVEPSDLVDRFEEFLFGEAPSLTGEEIAAEVGITHEAAQRRWRSLGFGSVDGDVPAFTHADLEALRVTQQLVEIGLITDADESALARTLGRSFARLAEWQMALLAQLVDLETMSTDDLREVVDVVVPSVEKLQGYVWRRHSLNAASRMLLAQEREVPGAEEGSSPEEVPLGVGFADIVNYTRQSRSMSRREIARMIDLFEDRSLELVTEHRGRVIKSIGDEILFVADDPHDLAHLGLALVAEHERDEGFPELRVGLAWGPALARLGDVFGPVVNVAARLTSTARPGRVLVDRTLAEVLGEDDGLRLRRLRRTSVRGYRRLEPWALKPPKRGAADERPSDGDRDDRSDASDTTDRPED